jgi:hypothetical protein
MNDRIIRLFQCAVYAWVALYVLAVMFLGSAAWNTASVEMFVSKNAIGELIDQMLMWLPTWLGMVLCGITVLVSLFLLKRHNLWLGLLVWLLFRIITHRTWLVSNGGVQLMQNMVLWVALIRVANAGQERDVSRPYQIVNTFAIWAARLQLLLVYAAAAAHKFTGTTWLDGSAMARVAADPTFNLGFLLNWPWLCVALTYVTLAWMTLFPFAVWWRPSRRIWLIAGTLFHLCTALFMGIPQMGLAFIVCYLVWVHPGDFAFISPTSPPPRT